MEEKQWGAGSGMALYSAGIEAGLIDDPHLLLTKKEGMLGNI